MLGADIQLSRRKSHGKILCNRNGKYMRKSECLVGCNDACIPCENKQLDNTHAGDDTLTYEQETLMRHEGIRGAGFSEMIAPFAEK